MQVYKAPLKDYKFLNITILIALFSAAITLNQKVIQFSIAKKLSNDVLDLDDCFLFQQA